MTKKTSLILILICICIIGIILGGVFMFISAKKRVEPKIKYAEFPFSLTYKINGEVVTVENTYVCEFNGVGWDTGRLFYRKWNGYVKETGLENVLICEDSERKIFCQVGDPRYYMGDDRYLDWEDNSLSPPHLYVNKKTSNYNYMSIEEIKQNYGIEIVSWNFSNPIKAVN